MSEGKKKKRLSELDEARLQRMGKWYLPLELPNEGDYVVEVKLEGPAGKWTGRREKIAYYGFMGLGPEVLNVAAGLWEVAKAAHAKRMKELNQSYDKRTKGEA